MNAHTDTRAAAAAAAAKTYNTRVITQTIHNNILGFSKYFKHAFEKKHKRLGKTWEYDYRILKFLRLKVRSLIFIAPCAIQSLPMMYGTFLLYSIRG